MKLFDTFKSVNDRRSQGRDFDTGGDCDEIKSFNEKGTCYGTCSDYVVEWLR